jgi:hypothetical protein
MGRNADAFDFLLGDWEISMLVTPEGTTVGRRATSHVHRILDGAALVDEIRHLDVAAHVNFRGASFRTYIPESDAWYVVWVMANVEGYSELRAEVIDGGPDDRSRQRSRRCVDRTRSIPRYLRRRLLLHARSLLRRRKDVDSAFCLVSSHSVARPPSEAGA